jgi:hypothetical protein
MKRKSIKSVWWAWWVVVVLPAAVGAGLVLYVAGYVHGLREAGDDAIPGPAVADDAIPALHSVDVGVSPFPGK